MKIRYTKIAATLTVLFLSAACAGSGSKSSQENTEEQVADSLANIPDAEIDDNPVLLPDTVYPSVDKVSYTVDVVDSSIDPRLSSLKNMYRETPGVFAFRKGPYRDAKMGGRVTGNPDSIVVDWVFTTAPGGARWGGGSGWSGQPVYVEWPDSCIERFKAAGVLGDGFGKKEIMVGSLCGTVYFLNFETGKVSRKPIEMVNPIKGSITLDPSLNGNLYVGQGIPDRRPFGAFVIDLFKHEVTHFHPEDPKAGRQWGAYDSSPVRQGQFLFRPGENGTLYKFLITPGNLTLQSALRFKVNGMAPGMEASIGIYSNYGYVADNQGNMLCVNLNTMRPVWYYDMGDDTDHSLVLEIEDGHPYIYCGSEIDKQGVNGIARYVKLDGLNGKEVWRNDIEGKRADVGSKHFDGGFYASSLPGIGDCEDMIFDNCVLNTKGQNGALMAFDRKTGKQIYSTALKIYAWSSPVAFLNENNEMYIFTADCAGNVYLIKGKTGEIIYTHKVAHNFESSPVVAGNSVVVGSRGGIILKMSIK